MNISTQAQAVLLLNAWFSKPEKGEPKPLTPTEWGRLALWLRDNQRSPEGLLSDHAVLTELERWQDRSITAERVAWLLGRSAGLGLALERWERAGLWVMIRSDVDYPSLLKKRLGVQAPPLFFGCGPRQLLARRGLAVVGARDADADELAFTEHLGANAAEQRFSVVSGGARGVDEAAMLGALAKGGTAVGVMADQLLRAATAAKYRKALMAGNLVLISPFNPEARFEVGNAMARNKYIYCLSDAAVVVTSSQGSGGTWNGAIENLKRGWVPLWVKRPAESNSGSGNAALVQQGARWLPDNVSVVSALFAHDTTSEPAGHQQNLFHSHTQHVQPDVVNEPPARQSVASGSGSDDARAVDEVASAPVASGAPAVSSSLYEIFLLKLKDETRTGAVKPDQLQDQLGLCKAQLSDWLKRAVEEGRVEKLKGPVRYRHIGR